MLNKWDNEMNKKYFQNWLVIIWWKYIEKIILISFKVKEIKRN